MKEMNPTLPKVSAFAHHTAALRRDLAEVGRSKLAATNEGGPELEEAAAACRRSRGPGTLGLRETRHL